MYYGLFCVDLVYAKKSWQLTLQGLFLTCGMPNADVSPSAQQGNATRA